MYKYALVSVSDKTGLVEFLKPFVDKGLQVVSTGGTAEFLKKGGIPVTPVSEVTGFPEVMDGRVRTLHPKIHMSLLARQYNKEDMDLLGKQGIQPFDLVVGNLYPFEAAAAKDPAERELMEFIDIGGPALLRASAKNFETITVVCDPSDYSWITEKKELILEDRRYLASKLFAHVSSYDAMIAETLGFQGSLAYPGKITFDNKFVYEKDFSIGGKSVSKLRYGENPQQSAVWFQKKGARQGLHSAEILQGKELSYNNLVDLDAACRTLAEFNEPCAVAVKHANPCGVSLGGNGLDAIRGALRADPVSVFGGIIATNQPVSPEMASEIVPLFLECVVAPAFSQGAKDLLSKKKNLRLLEWPDVANCRSNFDVKTILGGILLQTTDFVGAWDDDWKIVGKAPDLKIKQQLLFAWKVCAHLKSNAIAIAGESKTLGLGMGQVNRVDAVEQAVGRMKEYHGDFKGDFVLASDAFFPFADSIEKLAKANVLWVIQPGGSIRDDEVIAKAKDLGVSLILTGKRHFYH